MPTTAPTVQCKQEPGVFAPVINRNRCEGKEDCVQVCPYDVFEMGKLSHEDRAALPFVSRVKALMHRNRQAFAVNARDCHACGLCVAALPRTRHQTGARRVGKRATW